MARSMWSDLHCSVRLMALSMSDVVHRPIVVVYVIKNTIVGFDEHRAADSATPSWR